METLDILLRASTLTSTILGVVILVAERVSRKRRRYNENMRQLQLLKLRCEVDEIMERRQSASSDSNVINTGCAQEVADAERSTGTLAFVLLYLPSAFFIIYVAFLSYRLFLPDSFGAELHPHTLYKIVAVMLAIFLLQIVVLAGTYKLMCHRFASADGRNFFALGLGLAFSFLASIVAAKYLADYRDLMEYVPFCRSDLQAGTICRYVPISS